MIENNFEVAFHWDINYGWFTPYDDEIMIHCKMNKRDGYCPCYNSDLCLNGENPYD